MAKSKKSTAMASLQARLDEAEEALNAIRRGEVDALVVNGKQGKAVYTLEGADHAYRVLIEWINEGAATLTENGDLLYCNRCFADMVGLPLSEIITVPLQRFIKPSESSSVKAMLEQARFHPIKMKVEIVRSDGLLVPAQLSVNRLPLNEKVTFCVVLTDLTAQHRVAKELQEARKLEALGRLAGGVAHDFNNLITGIQGVVQDVRGSLPINDSRRSDLDEVIKAANRAYALTKQLLAFASRQVTQPLVMDANKVISETTRLLQRLLGDQIRLDVQTRATGPILIDPAHLEQILLNMAVNARDAMPQGGSVHIETQEVDCKSLPMNHRANGRCVVIRFRDTGIGMSPELLSQVFEPFFSTKDKEKGIGLGLATVYGIVRQSGGAISVESTLGKGTTFVIHFPLSTERVHSPKALAPLGLRSFAGQETLLVVEDEEIVRKVVTRKLSRKGYKVLEAGSGRLALEVLAAHKGPLDMIITDVLMPGMNGKQLVDHIRPLHPDVQVLFMSGYPQEVLGRQNVLEAGISFINKTEINSSLIGVVRDLLDAKTRVAT